MPHPHRLTGPLLALAALSDAVLRSVADAVLRGYDAAADLADSSMDAIASGRFDPAALRRPGTKAADCLGPAQVRPCSGFSAVSRTGEGVPCSRLALGFGHRRPGLARLEARDGAHARAQRDVGPGFGPGRAGPLLQDLAHHGLNPSGAGFDRIAEQTARTAAINDASSTMLSRFAARGGKLLV